MFSSTTHRLRSAIAARRGRGGRSPEQRAPEFLGNMRALNRDWRRHTRSHVTGLRPHVDADRDHLRGDHGAPLVLVEYGDFVSETCRAATRQVRGMRERFGADLLFVFRNFTIEDAHPHALSAAAAAEAAGAQGRYWDMHDLIYAGEFGVRPAATRGFAKKLGLDMDRFDREVGDETHVPHLFEDFNSGVYSGVNGAPTFFVNGARLDWDFETATLGDALESALTRAREARPA